MSGEAPEGTVKDPVGAARLAIAMCQTFALSDFDAHQELWSHATEDERFGAVSILTMWTAQLAPAVGLSWRDMLACIDVLEEAKRHGR